MGVPESPDVARPRLIVFCGLPGVGKSTASAYAAEESGATRYRSDEIRKELFDEPTYSAEESAATYDELFARVRSDLEAGRDVVADATFGSREARERVADVASGTGADLAFVHVTCPAEIVRERIAEREDVSDADFEVHLALREAFAPFERDHVAVDNSGGLEATYRQIDRDVL